MAATKTTAKKAVKKEVKAVVEKPVQKATYQKSVTHVIFNPRITEKATQVADNNVYTFNILPNATKTQVKEAVQSLYKVTPVKVNVVKLRQRNVVVRGKRGVQAGGRKAYVFLKKGDKIELM